MVNSDDVVRVLRVYEFVGPREWVESQVAKSIQGTKEIRPGQFIRAATVGAYPEMLTFKQYEAILDDVATLKGEAIHGG